MDLFTWAAIAGIVSAVATVLYLVFPIISLIIIIRSNKKNREAMKEGTDRVIKAIEEKDFKGIFASKIINANPDQLIARSKIGYLFGIGFVFLGLIAVFAVCLSNPNDLNTAQSWTIYVRFGSGVITSIFGLILIYLSYKDKVLVVALLDRLRDEVYFERLMELSKGITDKKLADNIRAILSISLTRLPVSGNDLPARNQDENLENRNDV